MVARGSFSRFPHAMVVSRTPTLTFPPPENEVPTEVISGPCNAQVGSGGSTENKNEAMVYDWTIYYDKDLSAPVRVGDLVEIDRYGEIYKGRVERATQGQLTNRIWCNNVSTATL